MGTSAQQHLAVASDATERISGESPPLGGDVLWRELRTGLWVGRSQGHHVGMIEQGRHFTLTDAGNGVHPGYSSLAAAQDAVTEPIAVVPQAGQPAQVERRGVSAGSLLSPVSLGMIALALAALVMISGLLQVF